MKTPFKSVKYLNQREHCGNSKGLPHSTKKNHTPVYFIRRLVGCGVSVKCGEEVCQMPPTSVNRNFDIYDIGKTKEEGTQKVPCGDIKKEACCIFPQKNKYINQKKKI